MNISERQLEKAGENLQDSAADIKLVCAPMEEECGIPQNYFDFVYSIYAIGWTTDLEGTFRRIASYLKPGGVFIFSWSHPMHKCISCENDTLIIKKSYFDESWYSVELEDGTITLSDRKLSTYINALAKAGFVIEEMAEEKMLDLIYEKFLGSVLSEEEQRQMKRIDDDMLYYDMLELLNERTADEAPSIKIGLSYEFVPFEQVEREFLEMYERYGR